MSQASIPITNQPSIVLPKEGVRARLSSAVAPFTLSVFLFALNNLAIISGWLKPPDGYSAMFLIRAQDIAQYFAWANGYLQQNLVPSYHAPWITEPAFFNLFIWAIAKISKLVSLEPVSTYHVFHFLFYLVATYALVYAVRVFTQGSAQFWAVFLVSICVVPLPSLAALPQFLTGKGGAPAGIGYFVWSSSDGFFHGISGSALVTFGTAATLLGFSLLAQYLKTEQRRYFVYALLTVLISALVHATEAILLAGAGGLALFWWRGREWKRAIPDGFLLGLALMCGLSPYIYMVFRHGWLRDLASLTHGGTPGLPHELPFILGLPAILVIGFLALRPKLFKPTDRLLLCWFGFVLIGIYVPVIHWRQHLFDGFHYATAILLVRLASQSAFFDRLRNRQPLMLWGAAGMICLLSISAYAIYYRQSFLDGRRPTPERLFSSVASREEVAVIDWIRQNARADELVLAPPDNAPWLGMAPIHTFAGHWIWSFSFSDQLRLANRFYKGEMSVEEAHQLIADYGFRYVVVNATSLAASYLEGAEKRVDLGKLSIYEFKGNTMKPYPGLKALQRSAVTN